MALPDTAPAIDPLAGAPDALATGAPDAAADDGSYRITIDVSPDGSFMVGLEGDEAGAMPADSIKDALTAALEIYRADGKATAEQQFDSGFAGEM